jgi:transposase-like protein
MERDFFNHTEPKHRPTPKIPAVWTTRWVPRRKAQVVAEVHNGQLSLEEACARYALTVEEFRSWQHAIDKYGLAGLRASHVSRSRH